MSLPLNQITHAEIKVAGLVSAAGVNSKAALFTFHYRRVGTSINPTKSALDTIFQTNIATPLFAALNNRITQQTNSIRWMDDPTDPPIPVSHALVGGVSGDSMPTGTGVYILYRTGLRGKRFRGNNKFFPVSESDTTAATADILNTTALANWATFTAAFVTPLTDSTGNIWNPCVYSRKSSKPTQTPAAVIITNDITLALINKTLRKSKRRNQKSLY